MLSIQRACSRHFCWGPIPGLGFRAAMLLVLGHRLHRRALSSRSSRGDEVILVDLAAAFSARVKQWKRSGEMMVYRL